MKNLIIAIASFLIIACGQEAQSQDSVAEVIPKTEFNEKISNSEDFYLIDVRTKSEFDQGSIPGALNYDYLDGTFQKEIQSLDKSKPIFVYCAVGGRSGKARKLLETNGFQIIYDLKGGYSNWVKN